MPILVVIQESCKRVTRFSKLDNSSTALFLNYHTHFFPTGYYSQKLEHLIRLSGSLAG